METENYIRVFLEVQDRVRIKPYEEIEKSEEFELYRDIAERIRKFCGKSGFTVMEIDPENKTVSLQIRTQLFKMPISWLEPLKTEDSEQYQKIQRPVAVTIIAILSFIGSLALLFFLSNINQILKNPEKMRESFGSAIGFWFYYYIILVAIINFIIAIGLWTMKRWSVWLYGIIGLASISIELFYIKATPSIFGIFIFIASLAILIIYYPRME